MYIPGTVMIKLQTSFSDLDEVLASAMKKNRWIKIVKKFENEEIYDDIFYYQKKVEKIS